MLKDYYSFEGIRRLFLRYGLGPWVCYFCNKLIFPEQRQYKAEACVVHHIDHDHENNAIENLVFAHHRCHQSHHHKGKVVSEETRRLMSISSTGRKLSPEAKIRQAAGISAALTGIPWSDKRKAAINDEFRQQMSERGKKAQEALKIKKLKTGEIIVR